MPQIKYAVEVDGERETDTFTTDDVGDRRAGWNPDVALEYARYVAVERFDDGDYVPGAEGVDVNTVEVIRLGAPNDQYDETGGVPL